MKTFFDKGFTAQYIREAQIASYLAEKDTEKENVVDFYGCAKKNKEIKFVMEYFPTDWDKSYYKSYLLKNSPKFRSSVY